MRLLRKVKGCLLIIVVLIVLMMMIWPLTSYAQTLASCVGAKVQRDLDANTTAEMAGSAGRRVLCGYFFENAGAGKRYVKIYNKGSPATVGTDVPVLTIPMPAGAAGHIAFSYGLDAFSSGISFAATTGKADNDTGAPTAGDVTVMLFYK